MNGLPMGNHRPWERTRAQPANAPRVAKAKALVARFALETDADGGQGKENNRLLADRSSYELQSLELRYDRLGGMPSPGCDVEKLQTTPQQDLAGSSARDHSRASAPRLSRTTLNRAGPSPRTR